MPGRRRAGTGGTGSGTGTLQQAYSAGVAGPQTILEDTVRLGIVIKDQATSAAISLLKVVDNAGTFTFFEVKGTGAASSAGGFGTFAGGTGGATPDATTAGAGGDVTISGGTGGAGSATGKMGNGGSLRLNGGACGAAAGANDAGQGAGDVIITGGASTPGRGGGSVQLRGAVGGIANAANASKAGGSISFVPAAGGAGSVGFAPAAGGTIQGLGGAGGAVSDTGTGGAGGICSMAAGKGGAASATNAGGIGGVASYTGGAGGNGSAAQVAGAGSAVNITGGAAGTNGGGGGANGGDVNILTGSPSGAGAPGTVILDSPTAVNGYPVRFRNGGADFFRFYSSGAAVSEIQFYNANGGVFMGGIQASSATLEMDTFTLFRPITDGGTALGDATHRWGFTYCKRFFGQGTALGVPQFALSAGWGTTASVGSIVGSDQALEFVVTSAGTGQGANPTIIITFVDGTWVTVPITMSKCVATTDPAGGAATYDASTATNATLTYRTVPVATQTYTFRVLVMGT